MPRTDVDMRALLYVTLHEVRTRPRTTASPCLVLQYPTIAAAVVPIFNVPEISASSVLTLSREALSGIFLGNVTLWSDPLIAATNPGLVLPPVRIFICVRLDKSGTTEILTRALSRFRYDTRVLARVSARLDMS